MIKNLVALVSTVFLYCSAPSNCMAAEGGGGIKLAQLSAENLEAFLLGQKVIKVRAALKNPAHPSSLEAVKSLGLDSRYYVMVRSWIGAHISMAESFRGTADYKNSAKRKEEVEERIVLLKKFLRAIDLE